MLYPSASDALAACMLPPRPVTCSTQHPAAGQSVHAAALCHQLTPSAVTAHPSDVNNNGLTGTLPLEWTALTALNSMCAPAPALRRLLCVAVPRPHTRHLLWLPMPPARCAMPSMPDSYPPVHAAAQCQLTHAAAAAAARTMSGNGFTGALPAKYSTMTNIHGMCAPTPAVLPIPAFHHGNAMPALRP